MGCKDCLPDFLQHLRAHPGGLAVGRIARDLGISRQHVYRLRDRVREIYGIWVDNASSDPLVPRGYLRIQSGGTASVAVTLSSEEAGALLTAATRIENLTPLARRALRRIVQGTPVASEAEREPVVYSPLADDYPPGLYEKVAEAIRVRRTARITYRNARGEEKTYRFDPYILIARDPHLYLVGANHNSRAAGHDPVHELRLDQIVGFRLLRDRFPRPHFDVRAYCRGRFRWFPGEGMPVRVRVRFSPQKAGFIRRMRHHPTQTLTEEPDGSVVWEVRVPLCEDLVHWIVSYGPHATVIEPEELRRRVVEWAQGAAEANLSPEGTTVGAYSGLQR